MVNGSRGGRAGGGAVAAAFREIAELLEIASDLSLCIGIGVKVGRQCPRLREQSGVPMYHVENPKWCSGAPGCGEGGG